MRVSTFTRAVFASTFLALMILVGPMMARPTPYDQEPAAVCCQNNGLIWDDELAVALNDGPGRRITVIDSCHSGGFVNELSARPLSYVAAACSWDEISWGVFGQTFMNRSKTLSLHSSFVGAAFVVLPEQLAQEGGDLGASQLNYLEGDRAVLFSASDPRIPSFEDDITTARNALTSRTNMPWPEASISRYYGDGATYDGAATRDNLLQAINDAKATLPETGNLFLYMNDHGTSTDVVKSRVSGRDYEYQTDISTWRGWTDDTPYGIWEVRHQLVDRDPTHYLNIHFDRPDWVGEVQGSWMVYHSVDAGNRTTWLTSGIDYDFGYTYYTDPVSKHVDWESLRIGSGLDGVNDWGRVDRNPDGSEKGNLGIGWFVWNMPVERAVDPELWPGWMNGGDGWVLAPIPEPSTIGLLAVGGICLLLALARRR